MHLLLLIGVCLLLPSAIASAEIVNYSASPEAVDHQPYIHVVSESDSPVVPTYIKAKDGVYIAAALRKPKGGGPFPAIVIFHGAPGGRGMDQLIGWSRGDHGGPVWERFLAEGFVVVVADYRGGDWNLMNRPSGEGLTTAIDDGLSVVEHLKTLPYIEADRISLYGVSLGGNLVMYLASALPTLHRVIAGAPAPIWFLGYSLPTDGSRPDFATMTAEAGVADRNIAPVRTPVLIQVGTADRLLPLDTALHHALSARGKSVRMEVYEHGYHDFVLGPQGQNRSDLPQGEILMQGALDALERAVDFVRSGE